MNNVSSSRKSLEDLLHTQVDLELDASMPMLRHPLVYSVPYMQQLNGFLNQQLKAKQKAIKEATENQNWGRFVFMHERAYRLEALHMVEDQINSKAELWQLLAEVWTDSENIFECIDVWADIFEDCNPKEARTMMNESEQGTFAALPELVVVYRGFTKKPAQAGYSWTTSIETASFFANRLLRTESDPRWIVSGAIMKTDILACFDGRGESEIVALPGSVTNQQLKAL